VPFQQAPIPELQQDLRSGVIPASQAPAPAGRENDGFHDRILLAGFNDWGLVFVC
jgi:hypothetical protein